MSSRFSEGNRIVVLSAWMVFVFSCTGTKQNTAEQAEKSYSVKIQLTQTSSYCGGAQPPAELLKELDNPRPVADKVVYVRSGEKNNPDDSHFVFTSKSNSEGMVEFTLPRGIYCVIFEEKKDRTYHDNLISLYSKATTNYTAIDQACLKNWMKEPELVIQVVDAAVLSTLNIHQPCSWNAIPCIEYRGPLPP